MQNPEIPDHYFEQALGDYIKETSPGVSNFMASQSGETNTHSGDTKNIGDPGDDGDVITTKYRSLQAKHDKINKYKQDDDKFLAETHTVTHIADIPRSNNVGNDNDFKSNNSPRDETMNFTFDKNSTPQMIPVDITSDKSVVFNFHNVTTINIYNVGNAPDSRGPADS